MEHSPHRVVSTPLPLTLPQVISVRHKMVGLGLTPRVTVVRERHRKGFWALSCLRFTSTTDFNYRLGLPPSLLLLAQKIGTFVRRRSPSRCPYKFAGLSMVRVPVHFPSSSFIAEFNLHHKICIPNIIRQLCPVRPSIQPFIHMVTNSLLDGSPQSPPPFLKASRMASA